MQSEITELNYALSVSCGNDSIALAQYLLNKGYTPSSMIAIYCNTGWSAPEWPDRVAKVKAWLESVGVRFYELESVGFESLVLLERMIPNGRAKFCTEKLKIRPFNEFLGEIDPGKNLTVCVGIRREESESRAQWPEYSEHEGWEKWAPMVQVRERERDELIRQAGFEVLPHRSKECSPCVFANRGDLRLVSERQIQKVVELERQISEIRGKTISMFNPKDKMGATGIRDVIKWAHSDRGAYKKGRTLIEFMRERASCDSGFCGG